MMNKYLKKLNKLEFIVTYACTGKCRHCSEGDHELCGERINSEIAASTVKAVAAEYNIKTVMVFGGEPLLHPDAVYAIISAAKELNVPKRQIITNGYFTKNTDTMQEVSEKLAECGVNDLLLSVDAFHQETIPLDAVRLFAAEIQNRNIPIRLQPAWLVSATNKNPYNLKTHEILNAFRDTGIHANEGNVIFPEGNALKYLAEYFKDVHPPNPYVENPEDVRCISVSPNGDVLNSNVYRQDIMDILNDYKPRATR